MQVNKSELMAALSAVKPGLAAKEIVEQMSHILFTGTDVATYNDQVCIMHPFKSDIIFSVKAGDFYEIISKITEADFEMNLEDGGTLSIKSKKTKAKLSTVVDEKAKIAHLVTQIKEFTEAPAFFKALPAEFCEALYLCAFSANKDMSTGVRACVAIKGDTACSTDNIRVSSYVMDTEMTETLLIAKDAMILVKYKPTEYGQSENWVHFRNEDGVIFSCKGMKGDYPYKMILGVFSEKESILTFPAELGEVVSSVISLAEGDIDVNKTVTVQVTKNCLTIKAEKERGWIEKEVDIEYAGEDFSFNINPIFFAQILKHANEFVILPGKAQFSSDNFYHVLALRK